MEPIIVIIGLGTLGVVSLVLLAFSGGETAKTKSRVERIAARTRPGAGPAGLSLRRGTEGGFDAAMKNFIPRPDELRKRLSKTGLQLTPGTYVLISLMVAIACAGGAVFGGFSMPIVLAAGALGGIWLPHMAVGKLIARRMAKFESLLPEALGLIVRGLKSGLPASESFTVVGREVGDPVGEEFRRMSDQIRMGQPMEAAMWEAAARIGTKEFDFLVISMSVQRETGGNLAETLENLDNILRRRRQMRLKVKAMSSEARASAMIIGSLPFLMFAILFLINRGYVMTLLTTDTGHTLLAVGGTSMAIGVGVIAKMIRFEI